AGTFKEQRAANLLDGGVPYYDLYATADGKHMSVGALEPQFYDEFVRLLEIADRAPDRYDADRAEALRTLIADTFRTRTQAEWVELFEGTDACVAGIIPLTKAAEHPHMRARGVLVERDGYLQPMPAPRFSRTAATLGRTAEDAGQSTREALAAWGVTGVEALLESGAAVQG
ncbi:MAG: CoA transferase, partial [Nocardioides sp.]|nr:CoA transferase [Nocardioides sp.]